MTFLDLIRQKKKISGTIAFLVLYSLYQYRQRKEKQLHKHGSVKKSTGHQHHSKAKVGVDAKFFAQVKQILPICVPGM